MQQTYSRHDGCIIFRTKNIGRIKVKINRFTNYFFVCVDALSPSQQIFSHVETFPGLNLLMDTTDTSHTTQFSDSDEV